MKSIKEKAEAYDKVLEWATEAHKVCDGMLKEDLEHLFPELKDSEDERIRKALLEMVHDTTGDSLWVDYNVHKEDAIAWLEKQTEHANFLSKIQVGDKVTRNEDGVLVNLSQLKRVAKKQGEQKPIVNDNAKEMFIKALERVEEQNAKGYKLTDCDKNSWWEDFKNYTSCTIEQKPTAWSEKYIADVFEKVGLAKIAREQSNDNLTNALQDAMIELSKFIPQPKQEWSEEDEYCRHQLIVFCENCMVKDDGAKRCAHWLKSFKERYTWKPSDEQMKILNEVLNFAANHESPHWNDYIFGTLNNLIRQLKKL